MGFEEEREFVEQLRRREPKAFTRLVELNQDRVFSYLYRMLGSRYEAAEVTQEVFIAAFRFIDSFRGESGLSTWLLRIASNMYKNRVRYLVRRRRSWEASFDDEYERRDYRPIGSRPDNPENVVATVELEKDLQRAIAALPDDFREVLVLRDIELLSYEEIEALTGLVAGTVKSRIHRARAMVARMLRDHLEGGEL